MTIAFVKTLPTFGGAAAPATTPSFTPTNNGDFLIYLPLTGDGNNENISGTGTGTWTSIVQFNTTTSATYAALGNSNSSAVSQTIVLTDVTVGFVAAYPGGVEYSGVSTVTNGTGAQATSPGLGAGAILGNSVVVPVGSILLALCIEPVNSETISSSIGGTTRNSSSTNPSFIIQEYAGAGSAIQPSFTASANGTANFFMLQMLLNPPANTASIAWVT